MILLCSSALTRAEFPTICFRKLHRPKIASVVWVVGSVTKVSLYRLSDHRTHVRVFQATVRRVLYCSWLTSSWSVLAEASMTLLPGWSGPFLKDLLLALQSFCEADFQATVRTVLYFKLLYVRSCIVIVGLELVRGWPGQ